MYKLDIMHGFPYVGFSCFFTNYFLGCLRVVDVESQSAHCRMATLIIAVPTSYF